jgi:hypothetical protein
MADAARSRSRKAARPGKSAQRAAAAPQADTSQALNREQRRRQRFHPATGARQDNLRTQRENATGFLTDVPVEAPEAPADAHEAPEASPEATAGRKRRTTSGGSGHSTEAGERAPKQAARDGGTGRAS